MLKLIVDNPNPKPNPHLPLIVDPVSPGDASYVVVFTHPRFGGGILSTHTYSFAARLTMKRHEEAFGMYCGMIKFNIPIVDEAGQATPKAAEAIRNYVTSLSEWVTHNT